MTTFWQEINRAALREALFVHSKRAAWRVVCGLCSGIGIYNDRENDVCSEAGVSRGAYCDMGYVFGWEPFVLEV